LEINGLVGVDFVDDLFHALLVGIAWSNLFGLGIDVNDVLLV
jgi:hypothetical protein